MRLPWIRRPPTDPVSPDLEDALSIIRRHTAVTMGYMSDGRENTPCDNTWVRDCAGGSSVTLLALTPTSPEWGGVLLDYQCAVCKRTMRLQVVVPPPNGA